MDESLWQSLRPDWTSLRDILTHGSGDALDVGSGHGRNRAIIEKAGYTWTGCDTTDYTDVVKGDAHNLPFDEGAFDLVVIWQVIEYLEEPWRALKEIQRVLKPGGKVVGSASFLEPMHGKVYFNFSQYGLEKILLDCGFRDISLFPGIGCFPLIFWSYARQLTGSELPARFAIWTGRISIWMVSLIVDFFSSVRRTLGAGGGSKSRWMRDTAPFHYAGQISFRAVRD